MVDFNSKLRSSYISRIAVSAFKILQSNNDLVISKADKGGQIVVLDKSLYLDKCSKLIAEVSIVEVLKDPSVRELQAVKYAVKLFLIFTKSFRSALIPSANHCARFYALPKVHKPSRYSF